MAEDIDARPPLTPAGNSPADPSDGRGGAAPHGGHPSYSEVPASEVVSRSVGGAAATSVVALLARGAGLMTTIVVTYFVSKAEYGNANLALTITTLLNAGTLLSPQQALLTRHHQFEEALALVRFFAAWSGVLVVAALVIFGPMLLTALGQPEALPMLWVFCGAMLLERLVVIPALHLNYRLRFSDIAKVEFYASLAYVAVTLLCAGTGMGGICLALGALARHGTRLWMLLTLLGARAVWPSLPRWGESERRLTREVLAYSIPVHLGGYGEFLTLYLDNVLVGFRYGPAAQGIYVVAYTLAITPCETIAIQGATAMVRALGLKDEVTRRHTYLSGLRFMSLLLFPIAVLTAVVAPTLEQAILPPRWREVAPISVSLCLGAMSMGIMRLAFAHLTAIHRPRLAALIEASRPVLFVVALAIVMLLDPGKAHLSWIGWGVSASFVVSAALALCLSLRADGLRIVDGLLSILPPALGTVVTAAALQGVRVGLQRAGFVPSFARLIVELLLGSLIYIAYLRLVHPNIYAQTRRWLVGQLRQFRQPRS